MPTYRRCVLDRFTNDYMSTRNRIVCMLMALFSIAQIEVDLETLVEKGNSALHAVELVQ